MTKTKEVARDARNNLWVCRKAKDGKPVKPTARKATKGAPF